MKKKKISTQISSRKVKDEFRQKRNSEFHTVKFESRNSTEQFPGYPYYPSQDDIMNWKNNMAKMELTENSLKLVKPGLQTSTAELPEEVMEKPIFLPEQETVEAISTAESNVSKEERQLLEWDQLSEDMGEDEELRTRVWPVDMSGEDLDVPGAELDDAAEEIGEEDEENNPYSIGGDRHEGMEQVHDRGR